jgi:DEAD/DEAH box helicase domain-containing protein
MILVLDIETQNTWDETTGFKTDGLKISYTGVINADTGEELDFWEADTPKLGELLKKADMVITYNGFTFDMPVIGNYLGSWVNDLPQLDVMVAAQMKIGYRPKLNNLSNATLGKGKLGSGLDAIKYFANGELDKLKKYCMEDVRLTLEVYKYGLEHGTIKYYDKNGFVRETDIDWNLGKKNVKPTQTDTPAPDTNQPLTLF